MRRSKVLAAIGLISAGLAVVGAAPAQAAEAIVADAAQFQAAFEDGTVTEITVIADLASVPTVTRPSGAEPLVLQGDEQTISLLPAASITSAGSNDLVVDGLVVTGSEQTALVWPAGSVAIQGSRFLENHAGAVDGGAIRAGADATLTITDSLFDLNSAGGDGGAIASETGVSVTSSTFEANEAGGDGGALATGDGLTIDDSLLWLNIAEDGGGFRSTGRARLTGTHFDQNTASGVGGGGSATDGIQVFDSYLHDNRAVDGGALDAPGVGLERSGLVSNVATGDGGAVRAVSVSATNSTIASNEAARGGGVAAENVDLTHATVAFNVAPAGANLAVRSLGSRASVIAEPVDGANCVSVATSSTENDNVEGGGDTCGLDGSRDRVDVEEVGLNRPDGFFYTESADPTDDSVLVDALAVGDCTRAEDQFGTPRPQGPACDIGAIELEGGGSPTDPTTPVDSTPTSVPGGSGGSGVEPASGARPVAGRPTYTG